MDVVLVRVREKWQWQWQKECLRNSKETRIASCDWFKRLSLLSTVR